MNSPGQRWQGPKSDYPWEQQALDFIKGKLSDDTHELDTTVTDEVLTAWAPPASARGRRRVP